jgi:methanogenic corrinoid protein MtbC1
MNVSVDSANNEGEAFDPEVLKDDLYGTIIEGEEAAAAELTLAGLRAGIPAEDILYDALIPALEEVGSLFEKGTYFVPEMLLGAKAMKAGLSHLRPVLAGPTEATALGNVALQAVATGQIASLTDARESIRHSAAVKTYSSQSPSEWDEPYRRFCALVASE